MGNNDRRYLLVVEGVKAEVRVFSHVLNKYGFKVKSGLPELDFIGNSKSLDLDVISSEDADVYIVSSKPNRLNDILKHFDPETEDFDKVLGFKRSDQFQGIFLIYDVDHNEDEVLDKMFAHFNNEADGLLLLQCPCLEVLGDVINDPSKAKPMERPSKEYKPQLNIYYNEHYGYGTIEYIKRNFEELALRFLIQNHNDFDSSNVMEHPGLVIEKIKKETVRTTKDGKYYCLYRYFTTVVYVFLAHIMGLTREIDNYESVKSFLENA